MRDEKDMKPVKECWFALLLLCIACTKTEPSDFPIAKHAKCSDGVTKIDGSTVWLCGSVSETNVTRISELLAGSDNANLVIDSLGGETRAAIRLARFVSAENVSVFVNKACLSACSQYVILGARRLHFRPHSLIGMHDTQTSTNILVGDDGVLMGMRDEALLEREFYRDMGIDQAILVVPTAALRARCIRNREEYRATGALILSSAFDFWFPPEDWFRSVFAGDLETPYPATTDVKKFISGSRIEEMFEISYAKQVDAKLTALPDC